MIIVEVFARGGQPRGRPPATGSGPDPMTIFFVSWRHLFSATSRSRCCPRFITAPAGVARALRTSPQSPHRAPRRRPVHHLRRPSALSDLRKTILCQSRCPAKSP
jgi:hypothetical protein